MKSMQKQIVNGVSLASREYLVFQLIGQGLSSYEIVKKLRTTPEAVDKTKQRLRSKLRIKHYAELTSYATREHLKEEMCGMRAVVSATVDFFKADPLNLLGSQLNEKQLGLLNNIRAALAGLTARLKL